jgi:hypothetical protein
MINWIKSLFRKKQKEGIYNVHHPDMIGKTEIAFEVKGVKYYRAIKDFTLPVGRYKFIDEKLGEAEIRMTMPTLRAFIERLKKYLDGANGTVNLGEAWKILYAMEGRCNLAWEPETIRQLAAIVYFDDTEDLRDYDIEYGQQKLAFWDKNKDLSFFLTRPICEYVNLQPGSEESLLKYIKETTEIIKDLTLDPEKPFLQNT